MKIQFDKSDLDLVQQVIDDPETRSSSWLVVNLFSNYALYKFFNIPVNSSRQLLKSPYLFKDKKKKTISIKSFGPDSIYPELKEYKEHRPFDLYIIAVYDSKDKVVWLDGWIDYKNFINEKNLYKDSYYLMSYRDLNPMEELL